MTELRDVLAGPMMLTAGFESGSEMTAQIEEQLKAALPEDMASDDMTVFDLLQMMPEEQRTGLISGMEEMTGKLPDTILDQAAVSYVGSAYKNLGIDMDGLQIRYLVTTGGKMAGLALLGMACAPRDGGQRPGGIHGVPGGRRHGPGSERKSLPEGGRIFQ